MNVGQVIYLSNVVISILEVLIMWKGLRMQYQLGKKFEDTKGVIRSHLGTDNIIAKTTYNRKSRSSMLEDWDTTCKIQKLYNWKSKPIIFRKSNVPCCHWKNYNDVNLLFSYDLR